MAEVTGLVIGVVGLAGSFSSCIDLFSYFLSAQSFGRDFEISTIKLDIEKALLLQWSERVRLLKQNYDRRLDDPATQKTISGILSGIKLLLGESESFEAKYGLKREMRGQEPNPMPVTHSISATRMQRFMDDFKALKIQTKARQEATHSRKKFRWAIMDREKFDRLIQDLSHFVSKLDQVIPDLEAYSSNDIGHSTSMLREEIQEIRDVDQLRLLRDATADTRKVFSSLADERLITICRRLVVDCIWFRAMEDRIDNVSPPHSQTLRWALEPLRADVKWDNLSHWLKTGSGAYWVSGKAGSGKSTLMKHLYNDPATSQLLSIWAGHSPLTVGSFFFWNLGAPEQKSQHGLSRALLHCIIAADQTLIPALLPRMWRQVYLGHHEELAAPSAVELAVAFDTLARGLETRRRFCFFIDGLDEYSGKYQDGIAFVKKLHSNPKVKVVVSSRPIPPCIDAFSLWPKLRLQDLTMKDISRYVDDTLGSHPYMKTLRSISPIGADSVLKDLINKASGVFLWVVVACRSLLDGFTAFDRVEELRERVQELPPELEDLFQHMLGQVEGRYHSQAAKMLRVSYRSQVAARIEADMENTAVCTLGLAILDNAGMSLADATFGDMPVEEMAAKCTVLEGRLRSRCGGLLEVQPRTSGDTRICFCRQGSHDCLVDSTVVFMHRTVFEFLDTPGVWDLDCLRIQNDTFDADAALSLMSLHHARLSFRSRAYYLTNAIYYGQVADQFSPDCALLVFQYLERLISQLPASIGNSTFRTTDQIERLGLYEDSTTLFLVEAGMINALQLDLKLRGQTVMDLGRRLRLPILSHALSRPLLTPFMLHPRMAYKWCISKDMVCFLLSQGFNPNEHFENSDGQRSTPWKSWLDALRNLNFEESPEGRQERDKAVVIDAAAITEEFIMKGADLALTKYGSNVVDLAIERYFINAAPSAKSTKVKAECGQRLRDAIQSRRAGLDKKRKMESEEPGPVKRLRK